MKLVIGAAFAGALAWATSGQDPVPLKLPAGFTATVVSEGAGKARHMAVDASGTIFVKLSKLEKGKGLAILRDTDKDGKAETVSYATGYAGTGIAIWKDWLYDSSDSSVYRYPLKNGAIDESKRETIVTGLTFQREHGSKSITLDDAGHLYVNFGAPSNACQERNRQLGSKGMEPCPILEWYGGIWQFDGARQYQKQADGVRFATGIRNAVALDWNPASKQLYALQHGRDDLHRLYPNLYTDEQNADLPGEEFLLVKKGADFGWPYCYYDWQTSKKVLAPEYGGDGGKKTGVCDGKDLPLLSFPGHWAPNDLLFYTGNQFPAKYRNGAFICFHGSWNRSPLQQRGYLVAFIPMGKDGKPSGKYEIFADNFAGGEIMSPGDAQARPVGLAQGADGSLYISDSINGKIWKITSRK